MDLSMDRLQKLETFLQLYLNHYALNSRWPCPGCGREDEYAPLRLNKLIREDGVQQFEGCHYCNSDWIVKTAKLLDSELRFPIDIRP